MAELAGAIVSAIKFLFDSIRGQIVMSAEKKKQWFNEHIEPSYKKLVAIPEDYTKSFSKALAAMKEKKDLNEVVTILKADRPNSLLQRQEVRENLLALRDYRLNDKPKSEIMLTFYDYVASVDDYLNAASPLPRETWYSYFIDTFSKLVEQGTDPLSHNYPGISQGSDAPKLAIEQLSRAIEKNMPEEFNKIQKAYAKLRAQCLQKV